MIPHEAEMAVMLRREWARIRPGELFKISLNDDTPPENVPQALDDLLKFIHRVLGDWREEGLFESMQAWALIQPHYPYGSSRTTQQRGWTLIKVLGQFGQPPMIRDGGRTALADSRKGV